VKDSCYPAQSDDPRSLDAQIALARDWLDQRRRLREAAIATGYVTAAAAEADRQAATIAAIIETLEGQRP
jgi:hypothetical protein